MDFPTGSELFTFQRQLKRYLSRLLRRPEDVDDAVQETLTKVLEAGKVRDISHSKTYAFRTAHNLAVNNLNLHSNTVTDYLEEILDIDLTDERSSIESQAIIREDFERLCTVIAQLPLQCRNVLILRKVYGMSQREVAGKLGIAQSTVEKHLAKGLARCTALLDASGGKFAGTDSRMLDDDQKRHSHY